MAIQKRYATNILIWIEIINKIKLKLSAIDDNMKASIQYGQGIRLLNQDLWETIISFIISANNNIPRIKGIIEKSVKHMEKK